MMRINQDYRDAFGHQPRCEVDPVVSGWFHANHDFLQVLLIPDHEDPCLCQRKAGLIVLEFQGLFGEFTSPVVKCPDVVLYTPYVCSDN